MTPDPPPAAPPPIQHIAIDAKGIPRVAGTRFRVSQVVIEHHMHGRTPQQIAEDYEVLSPAAVHAALAYYEDNRAVVDAEIERGEQIVDEHRAEWEKDPSSKRLRQLLEQRLRERAEQGA